MATSGLTFVGASGIDTKALVQQLMRIEAQPLTRLQQQQSVQQARSRLLTRISDQVRALNVAADALRSSELWAGKATAASSDDKSLGVTVGTGTPDATYRVDVLSVPLTDTYTQTATEQRRQFASLRNESGGFATDATLLTNLRGPAGEALDLATGTTISFARTTAAGSSTSTLTITDGMTLASLRTWMATEANATTRVLPGGRLEIAARPGTDNAFSAISLSSSASSALADAYTASTETQAATGLGGVQADETLTLGSGGFSFDIALTAGMTMQQVASTINAANGSVRATLANGALRLSAAQAGAGNAVTASSTGTFAAGLNLTHTIAGADGELSVNGSRVTINPNNYATVLPGVTINPLAVTTSSVTVTTKAAGVAQQELQDRVTDFVRAYNAAVGTITGALTERRVVKPTTDAERAAGVLNGDPGLTALRDSLRTGMMNVVSGAPSGANLASRVGLSTGALTGTMSGVTDQLSFDTAKFAAAFAASPSALQTLFATTGDADSQRGLAERVYQTTSRATLVGGAIKAGQDGAGQSIRDLQRAIDAMNSRLDLREKNLKAQYAAMDRAVQAAQGNGAYSSLFASMNARL